ncbi:MAG: glycosyltransferase family 4 protein [Patescibacteria group bacterium]|nr:glycosyltransferase family 4 protein [Patescibacteria group bacterium]
MARNFNLLFISTMRTILFTLEYPPFHGGIANYYGNLVKHWPQPNEIFVLDDNKGQLVKNWLWPKWLPAVFKLAKEIKKREINHVLIGQILPLGTAAFLASKFKNFEYSVIIHGLDFSLASRSAWKRWLSRRILAKANNIICGNSYVAKSAENFLGSRKKIVVVNPGINGRITHNVELITNIKKKYNIENKFILLTVGRLVKRKGVDMVLACLPEILKQAPNLIYVIVGDGPEEENIKKIIAGLKLEKNVLIISSADDKKRNAWLDLCDVFIMPARNMGGDYEGFGIVYLEANLAGKPVIAGASGGVGDAVVNGLNGLLVNPESEEKITEAVIKLARDENLRKKLGERGRERALREFSWRKQIEKIYNLILPPFEKGD